MASMVSVTGYPPTFDKGKEVSEDGDLCSVVGREDFLFVLDLKMLFFFMDFVFVGFMGALFLGIIFLVHDAVPNLVIRVVKNWK